MEVGGPGVNLNRGSCADGSPLLFLNEGMQNVGMKKNVGIEYVRFDKIEEWKHKTYRRCLERRN